MLLFAHDIIPHEKEVLSFMEFLGQNPWIMWLSIAGVIGLIVLLKLLKRR
jgi:hypothetical protein